MSWVPSSRPPLPPRPLSTYPSADYDRQQQQQHQSHDGRSSRQSIGSPPSMNYNFQPVGYTSPTPPPQFQQSSYQQQSQQYTQYQPQQAPHPVRSGIQDPSRIAIGRLLYVILNMVNRSTLMTRHIHLPLYLCLTRNSTNLLFQVHTPKPTISLPDSTISIRTQVSQSQRQLQHFPPQDDPSQARSCLNKCHHRPCPTCHIHPRHQ
jgi:hypothetical protein